MSPPDAIPVLGLIELITGVAGTPAGTQTRT